MQIIAIFPDSGFVDDILRLLRSYILLVKLWKKGGILAKILIFFGIHNVGAFVFRCSVNVHMCSHFPDLEAKLSQKPFQSVLMAS